MQVAIWQHYIGLFLSTPSHPTATPGVLTWVLGIRKQWHAKDNPSLLLGNQANWLPRGPAKTRQGVTPEIHRNAGGASMVVRLFFLNITSTRSLYLASRVFSCIPTGSQVTQNSIILSRPCFQSIPVLVYYYQYS